MGVYRVRHVAHLSAWLGRAASKRRSRRLAGSSWSCSGSGLRISARKPSPRISRGTCLWLTADDPRVQLGLDARAAVGHAALLIQSADQHGQVQVLLPACRGRMPAPSVVARARQPHRPAEALDGVEGCLRADEG
jgi:hypothetical protein